MPVLLVLCVGAALSIALFIMAGNWQDEQSLGLFDNYVDGITSRLQRSLASDEEVLGSIRGLYNASETVERHEFSVFVAGALARHPHFQALEWIPLVPDSQRAMYEQAARADGFTQFQFTERDSQRNMIPASQRQIYYPVYYLEPYSGNEVALGYDLGSNPERLRALEQARDSGAVVATARITLVQETGRQNSVLVILPVYQHGAPQETSEERRSALGGFALAIFRISDFVERSIGDLQNSPYAVYIYDMDAPEGHQLLYESAMAAGDQRGRVQVASAPYKTVGFDVGGRQWSLLVYPKSGQLPDGPVPLATGSLVAGLLMTIAVAGYVAQALRQTDKLAQANEKLKNEALEREESEAKYRELASSIPGIVYQVLSKDGSISFPYVSDGAFVAAGVTPKEIQADASAILSRVVEEDIGVLNNAIAESAESLQTNAIEFRLRHTNGDVRWMRAVASPHALPDGSILWNCVGLDITGQKRAEEALRESEEQYRLLFQSNPHPMWVYDLETLSFLTVNDAAIQHYGYTLDEFLSMTIGDLHLPEDIFHLRGIVAELKDTGGSFTGIWQHRKSDGATIDVEVTSHKLEFMGRPGRLILAKDITDRKRWEEERSQLVAALEATQDFVGLFQPNGRLLYLNSTAREAVGIAAGYDGIKDKTISDLHRDPAGLRLIADIIQHAIRDGSWSGEVTFATPAGRQVPLLAACRAHGGPDGSVQFVSAILHDITNRKQAEEELRNAKEFTEAVFDSVGDGICVIDSADLRIVSVNKAFMNASGKTQDEIIGRTCFEVTHHLSEPCETITCPLKETVRTGTPATAEHVHYNKDGKEIYVEVSTSPLTDKDGLVRQVVHTTHDITQRKLNEELIQRHVHRIYALRNIELLITSNLDLRVTLNVLVEQIVGQLHVDAADVLLLNKETQVLEYAAGRGFRTAALRHTHLRLGEGHAGRAAVERLTKNVPDLTQNPGELVLAPLLAKELFISYFAVPLIAKGEVKGVIEVFHRSYLESSPEWIDFLELLAGQASIAIDNASLFESAQRSNIELSVAYDATLEGWVKALDMRHKETEGHTQRVTKTTLLLARAAGLSDTELSHVHRGALLHDIGKIAIPDSILLKPGPLTEDEWKIMRLHPEYAYEFLSSITFLRKALDIPYCHHEKWDGTGYPLGLKGEDIPLAARLFAVVDVWDALRSDRSYRPAWPEEDAQEYLLEHSGTHFDSRVVKTFLKLLESDIIPIELSASTTLPRKLPPRISRPEPNIVGTNEGTKIKKGNGDAI